MFGLTAGAGTSADCSFPVSYFCKTCFIKPSQTNLSEEWEVEDGEQGTENAIQSCGSLICPMVMGDRGPFNG